jgi:hypothetical protein
MTMYDNRVSIPLFVFRQAFYVPQVCITGLIHVHLRWGPNLIDHIVYISLLFVCVLYIYIEPKDVYI